MTKEDKVKNIISFLLIIFGENSEICSEIMNKNPKYLIEKFERYVLSDCIEHEWGLHPSLRDNLFNRYCKLWKLGKYEETK